MLPALVLLLLLVLPGSKFLWFDGLPLSNWPERVALIITIFVVIPRTLRARLANLLEHRVMHGWGGTFLLVLLVAKLWSYFAFPLGGGFEVCLRSLYAPVESCEKSYESTFLTRDGINALGSISRTEDRIDFGPLDRSRPDTDQDTAGSNWNLPFTNDFPRLSELWLDRLPFTADIGTRVQAERDSLLPIALVGDLKVVYSKGSRGELGTYTLEFSSYDGEERIFVPVSEGAGTLRIHYEFKEGAVGAIPDTPPPAAGTYATLTLFDLVSTPSSYTSELLQPIPRDDPNWAQGTGLMVLNLALAFVLLGALIWVATPRKLLVSAFVTAGTTGIYFIISRALGVGTSLSVMLMVASVIGMYLVACRHGNLGLWMSAVSASLGAAPIVVASTAQRINSLAGALPWDHIMFRGRDSDWLVYQGYARQIFLDQSLRGGEATYYFVPGMRYVVFLQHLLLGDSDMVIAVCVLAVLIASTLLLFQPQFGLARGVSLLVVATFVATWLRPLILELVTYGAAEPIAWILLLGSVLTLLSQHLKSTSRLLLGSGLLSTAVFIRPNLFFAIVVILIWVYLIAVQELVNAAMRSRVILTAASILAISFFHNLHYGESSTMFTSFVTLDREFTLFEIFRSVSDSDLRSILADKVKIALSWQPATRNSGVLVIAWLLQAVWMGTFLGLIRKSTRGPSLVMVCVPLVYLLSMLPFRYTTITERHFVALNLFFGVTSLVVSVMRPRTSSNTR